MLTNSKQRGVSLIELLIGLVIVGILFAMGVPAYSGWIQNQQIRTAAESILNGIQLTRGEAVKNNAQARFVLCDVNNLSSSWEVLAASATAVAPVASLACGAGSNPGSNAVAGDVRVQERSGQEGSRAAQVVVTPIGATTVTFNSFGRVVDVPPITQIDVCLMAPCPMPAPVPAARSNERTLRITVGAGGNTRMCDPSPLLVATDPRHC